MDKWFLDLATEFAAVQWMDEMGGTRKEFLKRIPAFLRKARIEKAARLIKALDKANIKVELE
jgi:hypothetical protein